MKGLPSASNRVRSRSRSASISTKVVLPTPMGPSTAMNRYCMRSAAQQVVDDPAAGDGQHRAAGEGAPEEGGILGFRQARVAAVFPRGVRDDDGDVGHAA